MASKPEQAEDDISPIPMDQRLVADDASPAGAPSTDSPDREEPAPTAPAQENIGSDPTLAGARAAFPAPASSPLADAVRPGRSARGGNMSMRVFSRAMQDLDVLTGGTRAATYDEVDEYVERAIRIEQQLERAALAGRVAVNGLSNVETLPLPRSNALPDPEAGPPPAGISLATSDDMAALHRGPSADASSHITPGQVPGAVRRAQGQNPVDSASESQPGDRAAMISQADKKLAAITNEAVNDVNQDRSGDIVVSAPRIRPGRGNPYSAANLDLGVNAQYSGQILQAARESGLPPQTLAAIIGAEAARDRHGAWNARSANGSTSARGLTQFLAGTWLGEGNRAGSYLNGRARDLGYLDANGRIARAHRREFLNLRFNAQGFDQRRGRECGAQPCRLGASKSYNRQVPGGTGPLCLYCPS